MGLLILTTLFKTAGLIGGTLAIFVLQLKTNTLNGSYLYPLIPFDGCKLRSLLLRQPAQHRYVHKKADNPLQIIRLRYCRKLKPENRAL